MFKSSNFNFIYLSVTFKIPLEKQRLLLSIVLKLLLKEIFDLYF